MKVKTYIILFLDVFEPDLAAELTWIRTGARELNGGLPESVATIINCISWLKPVLMKLWLKNTAPDIGSTKKPGVGFSNEYLTCAFSSLSASVAFTINTSIFELNTSSVNKKKKNEINDINRWLFNVTQILCY